MSELRLISDRATRGDEAFVPIPSDPERQRKWKATMCALADDDGVIRGIPGGPIELVGWPEQWVED